MDTEAIKTQIQLLTAFVGFLSLLVGAGIAYLRLYTGNVVSAANRQLLKDIQQEFARKEMIDVRLGEMERRLNKVDSRTEALGYNKAPHATE